MNRTHKLIWSQAKQAWVAVGELAKAKTKAGRACLVAAVSGLCSPTLALAAPAVGELPSGGTVTSGAASISQGGNVMNINQSTHKSAINWNTFNVGVDATVNFNQPNANSVTLNRVQSGNPSQIFGQINANGQVFLTNPSGAYFSPSASVNVGALVASTHSITDEDFMAGRYDFTRNGAEGSIVNEGEINASLEGYVALLAPEVRNQGVIVADLGTVALAAGESYQLQIDSNGMLTDLHIEPATIDTLIENGHAVRAMGGQIIMSAQSINAIQGGVINNSGMIEATGLVNDGGRIVLRASDDISHTGSILADAKIESTGNGGEVLIIASLTNPASSTYVNGSISAKAGDLGGNGGFIETSASNLKIDGNTRVKTLAANGDNGEWLLDPVDFTIASSGGDMTGATLTTNLSGGDVTIESVNGSSGTAGDINVNDTVSWSANTLTLDAENNINITADMTVTSSGNLALEYGQGAVANDNESLILVTNGAKVDLPESTTNFTTKLGSDGTVKNYTVITSLGSAGSETTTDLQGIVGDVTLNYALGDDIDASDTSTWNSGDGFDPIKTGCGCTGFSGTFEGLGHEISNLTINRTSETDVGLFGATEDSAEIRNLRITGGAIDGASEVGAIIGSMEGRLINSSSTADVSATGNNAGGLVGEISVFATATALISQSHATGTVEGSNSIGGLVGLSASEATITNSYAEGNVSSTGSIVGGLVGLSASSDSISVSQSYATGDISGVDNIGGLLGSQGDATTIANSWAEGAVEGSGSGIGGLVGSLNNGGDIQYIVDSYAVGNVTGTGSSGEQAVGGLVGTGGQSLGYIENTYATGDVTAASTNYVGGLVGRNYFEVRTSYAIGDVTGNDYVGGLTGGNQSSGDLQNTYATGAVTGNWNVGGLVGYNISATIDNSYSTGAVTGTGSFVNGLVGRNFGTVTNSFWDTQTSGQASSDGGTPKTTAEMKTESTFTDAGWDFSSPVWSIESGINYGYPCLSGIPCFIPVYLRLIGGTSTYGDIPVFTYDYYDDATAGSVISDASPSGTVTWSSVLDSTSSVATYGLTYSSGITLGNNAYALYSGDSVNWSIVARPLTVDVSKSYDGTTTFDSSFTLTGMVNGDSAPTATGSATVSSADSGTYNSFASNSISLSDANYTLTGSTISAVITKAPLSVTAVDDTTTYDGTAYSGGNGVSYSGFVSGEDATNLSGTLSYTGNSQGATDAGSYTITPEGLSSNNYTFSYTNGALTIAQAPLSVTAEDASVSYDGSAYSGGNGVSYSGFVSGEDASNLSGTLSYTGNSQGATDAGSYTITPEGLTSNNYSLTYVDGVLTINEATTTRARSIPSATTQPSTTSEPTTITSVETGGIVPATRDTVASPLTDIGSVGVVHVSVDSVTTMSGEKALVVLLPPGSMLSGSGFSITLPEEIQNKLADQSGEMTLTLLSGEPLPNWIEYDPVTHTLHTTAVPDHGLPLQIVVDKAGESITMVLAERSVH